MLYLFVKSMLSGVIIMAVSEFARRSPSLGALIASLPLISVLGMIWLWQETKDPGRIALHATSTFWLVLPSLPMFLLLPALLNKGVGFYIALGIACATTAILYVLMVWLLAHFDITL
jgi:hypothetical protein